MADGVGDADLHYNEFNRKRWTMSSTTSCHRQVISRNYSGPGVAGAMSCLGANLGVGPCPWFAAGFIDEDESCL